MLTYSSNESFHASAISRAHAISPNTEIIKAARQGLDELDVRHMTLGERGRHSLDKEQKVVNANTQNRLVVQEIRAFLPPRESSHGWDTLECERISDVDLAVVAYVETPECGPVPKERLEECTGIESALNDVKRRAAAARTQGEASAAGTSKLNAQANPFNFTLSETSVSAPSSASPPFFTQAPHQGPYHYPTPGPRFTAAPSPAYYPYPIGASIMASAPTQSPYAYLTGDPNPSMAMHPGLGPVTYAPVPSITAGTPSQGGYTHPTGTPHPTVTANPGNPSYRTGGSTMAGTPNQGIHGYHTGTAVDTQHLPMTQYPLPPDYSTVASHLTKIATQVPLPPPARPYPTRSNAGQYTRMWNCCGCGDGPNHTQENMCYGCHHPRCAYCATTRA
ncbi:hypothetical protein BDV06DRAFT_222230 [Aspergillus oleicola]